MRSGRRPLPDGGFLLAEVVVAMTLFAILVVAALGILLRTSALAGQNLRRTTAANLLTRQLEAAQGVRALDIPAGTRTTTVPVGTNTYTVAQEVRYVSSADGTSLCDADAGSLLYKLVTVRVSWPDMQGVQPVRGDVLRALGVGSEGSDAARGALAVTVKDPADAGIAGATVTLPDGTSQVTDAQGCVVFVDLPPGGYVVQATTDGGRADGYSSGTRVTAGGIEHDTVVIYPPPPPPPPAPTTSSPPPAPTPPAPSPSPAATPAEGPETTPPTSEPTTEPAPAPAEDTPPPVTETTGATTPPFATTTTTTAPPPPPPPPPSPTKPRRAS